MNDQSPQTASIAFIGFGEAAQAFVSGWAQGRRVSAYDIKTDAAETRTAMEERYRENGVAGAPRLAEALDGADVAISVVTADQALKAAEAAADVLPQGALYLDCNSCAPDTKRQAAAAIEAKGGRYVDVAVMAPVHPQRHRVPLLLSGAAAEEAAAALAALDMRPRVIGKAVGDASAIKMIRSVMVKGMEALTAECLLAARRAGVEAEVAASLAGADEAAWWRKCAYNLERMMVHGARRAAEMREVAATVAALGLPARMSAAAAEWQDEVAATGLEAGGDDAISRADRILAALSSGEPCRG